MKPEWFPDWSGETCVIVASGPSAKDADLALAKGKAKFIAINRSHELAPWADVLYCCDFNYWRATQGLPQFTGLKLTAEKRREMEQWNIQLVTVSRYSDNLELAKLGFVGHGGNSGFQCLNLAVQFGVAKIILVGFDMRIDRGLHWHGPHPKGFSNPNLSNIGRMRRSVDNAAKKITAMGIEVINASVVSALVNYPKMAFADAVR